MDLLVAPLAHVPSAALRTALALVLFVIEPLAARPRLRPALGPVDPVRPLDRTQRHRPIRLDMSLATRLGARHLERLRRGLKP